MLSKKKKTTNSSKKKEKSAEEEENEKYIQLMRDAKAEELTFDSDEIADEDMKQLVYDHVEDAVRDLKDCKREVVLVRLDKETNKGFTKAIEQDLPYFFSNYNYFLKEEYQFPTPTPDMVVNIHKTNNLAKWKKDYLGGDEGKISAPNLTGGMVNMYNGYIHRHLVQSPEIAKACEEITGTKKWKILFDRLRLAGLTGREEFGKKSAAHIEGDFVGTAESCKKIKIIVGLSKKRSFVYYKGTAIDKKVRDDVRKYYQTHNTAQTNFVRVPPKDLYKLEWCKGKRRRIVFDGSKYFMLWNSSVLHEIDNKYASASVYLKPYNPEDESFKLANMTPMKDMKKKRTPLQGKVQYDPPQYTDDMTNVETGALGLAYHMAGSYWESGKKTFPMYHAQAFHFTKKNCKEEFTKMPFEYVDGKGRKHKKTGFRAVLPKGTVNHHDKEYQKKLKEIGIYEMLPKTTWDKDTPYFIHDLYEIFKGKPLLQYRMGLRKDYPEDDNKPTVQPHSRRRRLRKVVPSSDSDSSDDEHIRILKISRTPPPSPRARSSEDKRPVTKKSRQKKKTFLEKIKLVLLDNSEISSEDLIQIFQDEILSIDDKNTFRKQLHSVARFSSSIGKWTLKKITEEEGEEDQEQKQKQDDKKTAGEDASLPTKTEIVDQFLQCYAKSVPLQIDSTIPFQNELVRNQTEKVFDIQIIERIAKVSKTEHYGLAGRMLLEPKIQAILPKNVTFDDKQKKRIAARPKYLAFINMYYYAFNDENRKALQRFVRCAEEINRKYQSLREEQPPYLLRQMKGEQPVTSGILQWDVRCDLPEFVKQATRGRTWDPRLSPSITEDGRIKFNKCRVSVSAQHRAIQHLVKIDSTRWARLGEAAAYQFTTRKKIIYWYKNGKHVGEGEDFFPLKDVLENCRKEKKDIVFPIAWAKHARTAMFVHKKEKLLLFDPWMRNVGTKGGRGNSGFKHLQKLCSKMNIEAEFIVTKAEQAYGEGSCSVVALMRTLMLALYGEKGIDRPADCHVAILAQRLISMFRQKR